MKFPNIKPQLESLYTDEMDVYSSVESVTPEGESLVQYESVPRLEKKACRISFKSLEKARSTNDTHEIVEVFPKIFCGTELEINAGDRVVVRRYSSSGDGTIYQTWEGKAILTTGYPTHWENHQEFSIDLFGDA